MLEDVLLNRLCKCFLESVVVDEARENLSKLRFILQLEDDVHGILFEYVRYHLLDLVFRSLV